MSSRNPTMLDPDELVWPVSVRYHLRSGFGLTSQVLHFDVPGLNGDIPHTRSLINVLWLSAIAPAITRSVRLDWYEYVIWKSAPLPQIGAPFNSRGNRFDTPARRDDTGVLLLESGHRDDYGSRRLFAAGMPIGWSNSGLLTEAGWDGLMDWAFLITMGMSAYFSGGSLQLLLGYPGFMPPTVENLTGMQFRLATSIRVCQYTDRAPDEGPAIWP